jgi:CDP-glycerol glycerophosphotransferase (TagB/SpsB family)
MLAWAREDTRVEIVLKPHPALFTRLRGDAAMRPEGLAEFLRAWRELPNTALVEGGDYGPLFAGSDAMITDGISFLSEYQIFDRPLLFLDSGHHVPFNRLGDLIIASAQRVDTVAEARAFLDEFRRSGNDPTAKARAVATTLLRPFPGEAARRIVEDLRAGLARESHAVPGSCQRAQGD